MNARTHMAAAPKAEVSLSSSSLLQRRCKPGALCPHCAEENELLPARRQGADAGEAARQVAPEVKEQLSRPGQPLDRDTRSFFEARFGHDFGKVRVHADAQAARSAESVGARAWTVGRDVVFGANEYRPSSPEGRRLLAHELTHVVQQGDGPASPPKRVSRPSDPCEREADRIAAEVMQAPAAGAGIGRTAGVAAETGTAARQELTDETPAEPEAAGGAEGFEIDPGQLMVLPRWHDVTPAAEPVLRRQQLGASHCDTPASMAKVTSGPFQGGKTLDDYYPDLVGKSVWGSNNTAGTFDNGSRAGSAVQLIGNLAIPCATSDTPTTLKQTATIVRAKANGAQMMENGAPLAGQTINDIQRSGRDQSRAPFRQTWTGAVSMADPISGIPYKPLRSYEWEVNLTSSLAGAGGTVSVNWGVTVEATAGRVTKNEVR